MQLVRLGLVFQCICIILQENMSLFGFFLHFFISQLLSSPIQFIRLKSYTLITIKEPPISFSLDVIDIIRLPALPSLIRSLPLTLSPITSISVPLLSCILSMSYTVSFSTLMADSCRFSTIWTSISIVIISENDCLKWWIKKCHKPFLPKFLLYFEKSEIT